MLLHVSFFILLLLNITIYFNQLIYNLVFIQELRPTFTIISAKNQLTQICSEKRRAKKLSVPTCADETNSPTPSATESDQNKTIKNKLNSTAINNQENSKKLKKRISTTELRNKLTDLSDTD